MADASKERRAQMAAAAKRWRERHPERAKQASQRYKAANPEKTKAVRKAWKMDNPGKVLKSEQERRARNPEKMKAVYLRRMYGMDIAEFQALRLGHCPICRTDSPAGKGWTVDHCHSTGAVRGVICSRCNAGLGHFRDDISLLEAAIDYLRKAQERVA